MTLMTSIIDQYPRFEKGNASAQYQQIMNYCVNYLEGLVVNLMYMDLPENLEKTPDSYQQLQQALVKRERTVRHAFQFQVEKLFLDFKHIRRTRLHANRSSDWLSIGLTGQNSSKVQGSLEDIADKYQHQYETNLLTVSKRLKTLVHRSDEMLDDNPLRPDKLCNAFLASIEALSFSGIKICQLLELFDQVLENWLGDFYSHMELGLYDLGILPELTDLSIFTQPEEELNEVDEDLLESQDVSHEVADNNNLLKLEKLKELLSTFKNETEKGSLNYADSYARLEQDIAELVTPKQNGEIVKFTQYFNRLLDNPLLSSPLKMQLSRLSSPLVRMVLDDPFFFRSSSHPVNDFLHSIIDYEIRHKYDDNNLGMLSELIDQLLKLDNPVLSDYLPIINGFETYKQNELERKTLEKQKQEEEDKKISDYVLNQVNHITKSLKVSNEALAFFYDDWQLLLLRLAKKTGTESDEFMQTIDLARMLAWSLLEQKTPDHPDYHTHSFTSLLKAIDKGLNSLDYSSEHRHRVRKLLVKEFKNNSQQMEIKVVTKSSRKPSLPFNQNFNPDNSIEYPMPDAQFSHDDPGFSEEREFAQNMRIGTWVEVSMDRKTKKRAKLKWKATDYSLYIFVDQRGHKIRECSIESLMEDLASGDIKLLHAPPIGAANKPALGAGFHF